MFNLCRELSACDMFRFSMLLLYATAGCNSYIAIRFTVLHAVRPKLLLFSSCLSRKLIAANAFRECIRSILHLYRLKSHTIIIAIVHNGITYMFESVSFFSFLAAT